MFFKHISKISNFAASKIKKIRNMSNVIDYFKNDSIY